MNSIDTFCDREARRARARPTLAEALLTGREWAYAAHRTRFMLAKVPLRVFLHFVEVVVLGYWFTTDDLRPIFGIRAAMSVASALHWGALEPLRIDVRSAAARRAWTQATETIRTWVLRSLDVGLAQLGLAVTWILFAPSDVGSFSVFDAYALAAGLRLLLETVARTYAAGIGALRRVPRPFWAGVPGDVVDLGGAVLLVPVLGAWSFGLALLVGGVIRTAMLVVYARRGYLASPLRRLDLRWRRGRPAPRRPDTLSRAATSAVANSSAQLDAWLLIVLSATGGGLGALVATLHVLRPLLSASVGWVRLFYLDFKALEVRGKLLQERLDRFLGRVAVAFALTTATLVLAAWPVLWRARPSVVALWLVPFLVARSLFAVRQMQAFAYGKTRYLLTTAAALGAGLLAVTSLPPARAHAFPVLTAILFAIVAVAGRPGGGPSGAAPGVVGFYRFLDLVAAERGPARILAATVHKRLSPGAARVARTLATARGAPVAIWGNRHLVWLERGGQDAAFGEIAQAAAGCLATLRQGPRAEDGPRALRAAIASGVLEPSLARRLEQAEARGPRVLAEEFRRRFPKGAIVAGLHGRLDLPSEHDRESARRALGEVLRLAEGPGARGTRDVPGNLTAYCPAGEPELVFVLPPDTPIDECIAWRKRTEDASLAASMNG